MRQGQSPRNAGVTWCVGEHTREACSPTHLPRGNRAWPFLPVSSRPLPQRGVVTRSLLPVGVSVASEPALSGCSESRKRTHQGQFGEGQQERPCKRSLIKFLPCAGLAWLAGAVPTPASLQTGSLGEPCRRTRAGQGLVWAGQGRDGLAVLWGLWPSHREAPGRSRC